LVLKQVWNWTWSLVRVTSNAITQGWFQFRFLTSSPPPKFRFHLILRLRFDFRIRWELGFNIQVHLSVNKIKQVNDVTLKRTTCLFAQK
jgi:hypothetical protein